MKNIEFRGKNDNGIWLYGGYYSPKPTVCFIAADNDFAHRVLRDVIPETVGQYIGRTDKNENKLFTDDIVKKYITLYTNNFDNYTLGFVDSEVEFEGYVYGVIKFVPSKGYVIKKLYTEDCIEGGFHKEKGYMGITASRTEKIGNIHDNPELLEAKK